MAAGFNYFNDTDVGAPGLWPAAGRGIAVLDWILVTKGGWTKVYTGTNLAVYRSDDVAGNRFYLRVDDTQALYTRLRCYRVMTAVSTGTSIFPTTAQATSAGYGFMKGSAAGTTPRRYWGIRTNRYFALFAEAIVAAVESVNYRGLVLFGDVPSLTEADAHNTIVLAGADNNTGSYNQYLGVQLQEPINPGIGYPTTGVKAGISGTPNGAVVSPLCGVHTPFGVNTSADAYTAAIGLSQRMYHAPLIFGCSNSATVSNGAMPRARIPNVHHVYNGCKYDPSSNTGCNDLNPLTIGGRTFLPIQNSNYGAGSPTHHDFALMLETTDTDGAL